MLDSRIARSPGSPANAAYGSPAPVTTPSRARWEIALASSCPRASLSSRNTRARRATCTALSITTARPTMVVTAAICLALMLRRISGVRNRFFLLLARRAAAELIQLVVQRLQADAEDFRGARLVVACVLERHQDQPALGFLDRRPWLQRDHRLDHVRGIGDERRQMLRLDEFAVGQNDGALDHIAHLAHVAGPVVLLEHAHRRRIDGGH